MPNVSGVHHVALTVSDLARSGPWYQKVFDGQEIMSVEEADYKLKLFLCPGNFMIGLHEHASTPGDDRFSEFRVGLDHISFGCGSRSDVEEWAAHLDGLAIEHSGVADAEYGHVLVFRDPDNIQLEFFSLPG